MKDSKFTLTKALPNANASNLTASMDLNIEVPFDNKFREAYVLVTVPALSDHTDSTKTDTLTLQDSADNSSFANTAPLIQVQIAGVATTGSAATTVKVPLPPGVRRYIQFNQLRYPTGGVTGRAATRRSSTGWRDGAAHEERPTGRAGRSSERARAKGRKPARPAGEDGVNPYVISH